MANTELLRLTKAATAAFNAYKSALRQKGHKISGEIDLAGLTGLSGWEESLKKEWLAAVRICEAEAGAPSQAALDLETGPEETPNPLDLFINHRYRHIESGIDYMFRFYNSGDDLYSFYNEQAGGIRGSTSWVREAFDLANAPEFDPTIPLEDPAITAALEYDEEDGTRYVVKRVAPERFKELVNVESGQGLRKKNPTAKSIEMISDCSYVVTDAKDVDDIQNARVFLSPCSPVETGEKGQGIFKCGKERWKITGEPIIVKIVSLEELHKAPDEGDMDQADPLAWCVDMVRRGYFKEEDGEKSIPLAPRSFEALKNQIAPNVGECTAIYVPTLDMNATLDILGMEIDGYEELVPEAIQNANEEAVQETLQTVSESGESASSVAGTASDAQDTANIPAEQSADVTTELQIDQPTEEGNRMIDVAEAHEAVNQWDMQFDEKTAEGLAIHVKVKFEHEPNHDLFCIEWLDVKTDNYKPVAWLVNGDTFAATKKGTGDYAKGLCQATLEIRLAE